MISASCAAALFKSGEEYGGRDLPTSYALTFRQEEDGFDVPRRTEMFSVTQQLVAPAVAHLVELPLEVSVPSLTVMARAMPYFGRG